MPSILENRKKDINHTQNKIFDAAIIGGGINGNAIALELSLRGYNVIVV